jgi:hypothetical protein
LSTSLYAFKIFLPKARLLYKIHVQAFYFTYLTFTLIEKFMVK